ncbi:DUF3307 domain-containing protein [Szabonella alba]|uniref:DUF3307 domain-containing protein n=1 Tax=Szabonella alba TaxID=2804194 RepID=A0A8K0VAV5_9RHOB|nr:DUF3307 domain-containing protein [Szabonella alba]MBL4918296.1 DUF3307 domain-containing protein [Szabonella alba]
MTETFAALLLAHVLADFIFQTRAMVAAKHRSVPMLAHGVIVLVTAIVTTGSLHPALLALAVLHLLIDLIRTHLAPRHAHRFGAGPLSVFLADQALHLLTLAVVALAVPGLYAAGLWGQSPPAFLPDLTLLPGLMALLAGLILATRAGGFAVGFLMAPWSADLSRLAQDRPPGDMPRPSEGLLNAGQAIGLLERGLIFLLVLTGQPAGIGFLIAAKSVLRFGTVGNDRAVSEYVIIGTLASFGWAIAAAHLTVLLLAPLGISLPNP